MGGKSTTNQNQVTDMATTSQNQWDPRIQRQFEQQYGGLSKEYQNRISQPLNLEYAPAFSTAPDAIVQGLLSQGIQGINNQQTATNNALAQRLSVGGTGDNSALLAALQARSKFGAAGATNALIPQAMQQQREFDLARQNIIAQQNQQRLAARGQSINELAPGMDLLSQIQNYGTATGKNTATQSGTVSSTSKTKKSYF
jgi:hypothetical protein